MREKDQKLTIWAKIFLILSISALVLGNGIAIFIYFVANSEMQSYSPEMIQDGLSALAFLSMRIAWAVACILAAGIGNLLSILFSSLTISFSSKAIRACRHAPPCQTPHLLKPASIILLIISIIALLLTLPAYFLLSFFLGV